jgi:hypothetical protein
MNPTFKSVIGSPGNQPEARYPLPNEEFVKTLRITRSYAKILGKLHTTSTLLRMRDTYMRQPENMDIIILEFIEDLIQTTLQDVLVPLDQIPPTPIGPIHRSQKTN